jgi:hypothetical protein
LHSIILANAVLSVWENSVTLSKKKSLLDWFGDVCFGSFAGFAGTCHQ